MVIKRTLKITADATIYSVYVYRVYAYLSLYLSKVQNSIINLFIKVNNEFVPILRNIYVSIALIKGNLEFLRTLYKIY